MHTDRQKDMVAWFHSLKPIDPVEMIGLWKGAGVSSGHPLDGVLEKLQWFGKHFHPDMRADALLFQWHPGRLVAIDPRAVPIGLAIKLAPLGRTILARNLFSFLYKAFRAKNTTAALEIRTLEQIASAPMIYDKQPIVDHFRRMSDDTLIGMMCLGGDERRFFFKLIRIDT